MARVLSNTHIRVAWVPAAQMTTAQAAAPTDTILNAVTTVQLTNAIAWQDFSLGAQNSNDLEDRSIVDPGNAVSRGLAQFGATLSFFRDANSADSTSDYNKAFATFKTPRTYGYLVIRVADRLGTDTWTKGDRVSVFYCIADTIVDDATGEDAVKFTVNFLQQGFLAVNTIVKGATPDAITGVPTTLSKTVAGGPWPTIPTLSGKDIRTTAKYTVSDTTKATVSKAGVVTPLAAGTVTLTVSHPAASGDVTQTITLT